MHAKLFFGFISMLGVDEQVRGSILLKPERPQPPRKSQVQIRFEILEFLFYNAGAHSKTSLWRRSTQLSYDDFQKYLQYLSEKQYVQETEQGIRLTTQGRDVYARLREALPSIL